MGGLTGTPDPVEAMLQAWPTQVKGRTAAAVLQKMADKGPGASGETVEGRMEGERERRTGWCAVRGKVVGGFAVERVQPEIQAVLRRIWPGRSRSSGSGWFIRDASIFLP